MTLRRTTGSESGLAGPALHIMLALGHESKHGYAIMRDIDERSGGAIQLLPGTLYSTMKKLLDEGLVEECDAPNNDVSDDARRRYYRVTKRGKATVKRERERLALLLELGEVFG